MNSFVRVFATLAEEAANLLEAGELVRIREPSMRHVDLMYKGPPDLLAMRVLLKKYMAIRESYERDK